jgi:hypothetical protein
VAKPEFAVKQTAPDHAGRRAAGGQALGAARPAFGPAPLHDLQRALGNQTMLGLLEAGMVQAKLRLSRPGDPDEQEADHVAARIVSNQHAPVVARKCKCAGGARCAQCSGKKDDEEHWSPSRTSGLALQRAAAAPSPAPPRDSGPSVASAGPRRASPLIVEDDADSLAPGQMKKTAFFDQLQAAVCATADAELATVGRSSKNCPYVERWLAFYAGQSAAHIEQALLKYAPEAAAATSARDYIVQIRARVRKAVATWARTGTITGVPEGAGLLPPAGAAPSGEEKASGAGVQLKARAGESGRDASAESVRAQLGPGRPLDTSVRDRMGAAFGREFSSVRLHDDSAASALCSQLDARAFTLGNDVAFAAGEYQPGGVAGDALIAHELAHVVQQGAAGAASGPMKKGSGEYDALEQDADRSAVGAIRTLWSGARSGYAGWKQDVAPRLASGLALQRCSKKTPAPTPGPFDFSIRGKAEDAAAYPNQVFFLQGAAVLDKDEKAKIAALAKPPGDMLTLNAFASEEEAPALDVAKARVDAVAAELVTAGHDAAKITKNLKPDSGTGRIDYRTLRAVEIVKPGGTSAVPAGSAPSTAACAGSTETDFTDAEREAEALIDKALTGLGPPVDPAMAPLLSRFFRNWTPADAVTVKLNLAAIKAQLHLLLPAANHQCANARYAACVGADAENNGDGSAAMMTMCPSFFAAGNSKKSRGGTLIHESAHGTPGLDTVDNAYAHERLIEFLNLADALKNSDSYVLLVRLFDTPGSVNVGPVAKDPLDTTMSPGEKDAARRTMAWLEKWLIWSYQEMASLYDTIVQSIAAGYWKNGYYKASMGLVAPLFGLSEPSSLPTATDKIRVAAIHDRFHQMRWVEFQTAVTIHKVAGPEAWAPGPGSSVSLGPDFFADTPRGQLDRMLTAIVKATPDISPAFVPQYVTLADRIRKHGGGGEPT